MEIQAGLRSVQGPPHLLKVKGEISLFLDSPQPTLVMRRRRKRERGRGGGEVGGGREGGGRGGGK